MKKISALLLALAVTAGASSCGSSISDAELTDALRALAPKAVELYEIVYNDALPYTDVAEGSYYLVSSDAPYTSAEALLDAMESVFTPGYTAILCNTAFTGVSTDEGRIGAKFSTKNGALYVNPDATTGFAAPRELDLDGVTVIKKNPFKAIVSVPAGDGTLEVMMQKVEGKWLLDSPIY